MAEIRYVFMDSQTETLHDQSQRVYWYEKLMTYRRVLTDHYNKARFLDGDCEEMIKCERAFEHVDALLAKCHESVHIEVTVSAPCVHLFDMQRAVGMIQSITGIAEND